MAGRPESPLDPSAGPVARLAAELRKLRAEAGSPSYRVMAERTDQGASTLSQAAAGERLPTLPVVLAYVRACGGDEAEWEGRWREVAAEPRAEDEGAVRPYRGLARFEPGDADLFFGRGQLTGRLLELASSRRFTAVFGPSGSGKSSLLRAGLIPRLRSSEAAGPQPAALRVLTPGEHPLRAHEQRLSPKDADGDTWLIVDQFEELYTLCHDPAERDQFIDRLLAATDPGSRLRVVIAVRADFLGRCAEHAALTAALQDGTVLAGPMSRDELREAVVRPAQAGGLVVERSLTARILDEVEGEPGALPLMSHALLVTWHRRKGRVLTEEAYEAAGGLYGAVARTAERVFSRLTPGQAEVARRVFLRLIAPGDGTQDTRRPVTRAELGADGPGDVATVLERLARARLIILDHDIVDLAHEALITSWPRLRGWIDTYRERLRIHRRLTEAAQAWEALDRDPGALYRGTRLAAAEETFTERSDLSPLECAFLTASLEARDREQRAAARTTRRLRSLVVGLTALVLVACTAASLALQQRATARTQRAVAVSRQIAAEADQLRGTNQLEQAQNATLAAQLDIASYWMHPSARTYTSLVSAVNAPLFTEISDQSSHVEDSERHPDHARAAADSRRRLLAIIGEDSLVRLWDTRDFRHPKRVGRSVPGTAMALSPDGSLLAVEGDDFKAHSPEGSLLDLNRVPQVISLWDTSDPRHLTQLVTIRSPDLAGNRMAFSPDGHLLAVGGPPVYLWDVRDRRNPARVGRSLPGDLPAFSPRQHVLATADTGTESGTVQLWDTSRPSHLKELSGFDHGSLETKDLVFSPDGQTLATNGADGGQLRLWDTRNPKRPTVFDAPLRTADGSEVTTVAFSLDGRIVAVAGTNGIQLWNIGNRLEPQRLGGPLGQPSHAGIALIFGADDRDLITDDRVIRVWKLPPLLPLGCLGPSVVGFSLDKQTLVTACDDPGRIHIWSTSSSGESEHLSSVPGRIAAVASNGRLLAVVDPGDRIRLWDVTDPAHPRRLGRIPEPGGDAIACLALSGDGRTLAEYERGPGLEDSLKLWQIDDPLHPRPVGLADASGGDFTSVVLNFDGTELVLQQYFVA